jgi:hypothetical protein
LLDYKRLPANQNDADAPTYTRIGCYIIVKVVVPIPTTWDEIVIQFANAVASQAHRASVKSENSLSAR